LRIHIIGLERLRKTRVEVVSSAEEYREFAEQCLSWAKAARSAGERVIFLEMAPTWFQVAALIELREKREAPDPPSPDGS
jgi:hypothetical protein